jgi:hypothetical protein
VLLWLRCPALRDLVNDFWQQGGGSHTAEMAGSVLELSIDASDEVVETICHYVHYGGLILPPTLTLQLETLKVASELGLLALQDQLEHFLCQDINGDNLDVLYQAAQENHYRRIENSCVRFMNGELQDHHREEILQRTLASSIQDLNIPSTGVALRTKDLHDFEDVPDDVLQGTFNQTASRGGNHVSETFGGQLTASNPSVDYRIMNEEADNYMQSLKMSKKMQEYEQDLQTSETLRHRPNSGHNTTVSGAHGKTKSGGIYSLLLGENEDGFGNGDMYSTNQYGQEVMKDIKRPPSGQGKTAGLANTTAGARKNSSSGGKNVPNLQEFDPSTMSLVPKKEKSEHEKRLEELSRPRSSQQTPSSLRKNSHDLEVDTSMTSDPSEASHHPTSTRSTTSGKESLAKTTSSVGAKRPGSASAAKTTTAAKSTSFGKRPTQMEDDDEPLPDDVYLDQGDYAEDDYVLNQNPRSAAKSAPSSQSQLRNSGNKTAAAPLLSSTSNPRLRTSTEPVFNNHGDNDYGNNIENASHVEGGTQIRSSLALLKAKVSKTAGGRTRRISAGAAIGNFAQANEGVDSESSSPVPSSSSAGQLSSAPNSLGNTLENHRGSHSSGIRQSQQQQSRYGNSSQQRGNAFDEGEEDYADDFDSFPTGSYSNQTSKNNTLQRTSSRSGTNNRNNNNNNFNAEDSDFDAPPRSSAATYLQLLETVQDKSYSGGDADDDNMGAEYASGNTEECPDCGRHFAPESLLRHTKICKKVFLSKRKVFNSSKQRLDANPETLKQKKTAGRAGAAVASNKPPTAAKSAASKWKEQSKQFREAMRAVRGGGGGGGASSSSTGGDGSQQTNAQPAQPYIDPTLIQCPNCLRRFSEKAAERHLPVCQKIIAKPSSLKKGGGQTAGSLTATQTRTAGSSQSGGSSSFNGARTTGGRSGGGGGSWN